MPVSEKLEMVREHLKLYEHPLIAFSAAEEAGVIQVEIELKNCSTPAHIYKFAIHARDLDHPQFAWNLQRQLYDALHDYLIEMFTRTPQDRTVPTAARDSR